MLKPRQLVQYTNHAEQARRSRQARQSQQLGSYCARRILKAEPGSGVGKQPANRIPFWRTVVRSKEITAEQHDDGFTMLLGAPLSPPGVRDTWRDQYDFACGEAVLGACYPALAPSGDDAVQLELIVLMPDRPESRRPQMQHLEGSAGRWWCRAQQGVHAIKYRPLQAKWPDRKNGGS